MLQGAFFDIKTLTLLQEAFFDIKTLTLLQEAFFDIQTLTLLQEAFFDIQTLTLLQEADNLINIGFFVSTINTTNTHIHDGSFSWLGTGILIKSGGDKLVLLP